MALKELLRSLSEKNRKQIMIERKKIAKNNDYKERYARYKKEGGDATYSEFMKVNYKPAKQRLKEFDEGLETGLIASKKIWGKY